MNKYYFSWNLLLNELNDFSCKVEFLQSRFRRKLVRSKIFSVREYVENINDLLQDHTENLNRVDAENYRSAISYNVNKNDFSLNKNLIRTDTSLCRDEMASTES